MAEIGVYINVPDEEYLQHLAASTSDETYIAIFISFGGIVDLQADIFLMLYMFVTLNLIMIKI